MGNNNDKISNMGHLQIQTLLVYGYISKHYRRAKLPNDIMNIIVKFYQDHMESSFLNINEQLQLLDLLKHTLKTQPKYKSKRISVISLKLLYRASDNEYAAKAFHDKCDKKGPTVTIIHSKVNHVFGVFLSESYCSGNVEKGDSSAFLFGIRPIEKVYKLKSRFDAQVMWGWSEFGPCIGKGNDICIWNNCNINSSNCNPSSFEFKSNELCGGGMNDDEGVSTSFLVEDYEVYSVHL